MEIVRPLRFADDALEILDQTLLPAQEVWLKLTHPEQVIEAIQMLRVRGAPAIGVAGAFALALAAGDAQAVRTVAPAVAAARPTAVNLSWAVERMLGARSSRPPPLEVLSSQRSLGTALRGHLVSSLRFTLGTWLVWLSSSLRSPRSTTALASQVREGCGVTLIRPRLSSGTRLSCARPPSPPPPSFSLPVSWRWRWGGGGGEPSPSSRKENAS